MSHRLIGAMVIGTPIGVWALWLVPGLLREWRRERKRRQRIEHNRRLAEVLALADPARQVQRIRDRARPSLDESSRRVVD
jgi:hypothetical protein